MAWTQADKDKQARYIERHPERVKETQKKSHLKYAEKIKKGRKEWQDLNWPYYSFGVTRRNAEVNAMKRKVPFNLTTKYLHELYDNQNQVCAISGLHFKRSTKGGGPSIFSTSLDRIVPSLGYVQGNVRFILHGLNSLKSDGTDEDVYTIVRAIIKSGKHLAKGDPICPVDGEGMN